VPNSLVVDVSFVAGAVAPPSSMHRPGVPAGRPAAVGDDVVRALVLALQGLCKRVMPGALRGANIYDVAEPGASRTDASADPRSFRAIVQTGGPHGPTTCAGLTDVAVPRPVRVLVLGEGRAALWRDDLARDLIAGLPGRSQRCDGPGGLDCWATSSPVHNVLVVVAGLGPPSAEFIRLVDDCLADGFEPVGVCRAGTNPDVVLPPALRSRHAPSWVSGVHEVTADLLDMLLLDSENRRVFISYAHADGSATAERLALLLTRHRFDVFLDRFRLSPGVDFVERITDELSDKAMVVVVETPESVRSAWVRREVLTARSRRLGLAAINLGAQPRFTSISETARCRIDDDAAIRNFVVRQHRDQLRWRRESLMASAEAALRFAGAGPVRPSSHGFLVGTGPAYDLSVQLRPADLHRMRVAGERCLPGVRAVVSHPRPARADRRRDLDWLANASGVVLVDEGRLAVSAARIAAGTL
jgi:hypothetical protein